MSLHAIQRYHAEVEKLKHFGGTHKETAIRNAFYNLLNDYAKPRGLMVVPEVSLKAPNGKTVTPDGTLKDTLRQDWGHWESKDESDNINDEIQKKFTKGYPKENILFEDSHTAVLIQNGEEKMRIPLRDDEALDHLLHAFMSYERPEVSHFRKAIELFRQDIPKVTETVRELIEKEGQTNTQFQKARARFLKLCHSSINPDLTTEDVNEMMLQHILTEDIFNTIFDETQFHRENNIARELEAVIHTFFTGATRRTALSSVQHYYQTINAAAATIADHHEKQKFLKVVYETFYKSYNPKAADRLGVVYTPNEIVRFMVESTDYLLHRHFNRFLGDKGVEILDPATGTGTFICDIIDFLRKDQLEYKYHNELHANEVAILPYYISNLNIEYTYKQKMGRYAEFQTLCFVDTIENTGFKMTGVQNNLFAPLTEENTQRIRTQNSRKISVIIGNPPYNANQQSENDNNKNRTYAAIDQRIKDTFIKHSTAQKTKVYDMYARFYRWAFDRIKTVSDQGIIAFVTNRSFIDSRTFDGFRKTVQDEFDFAYIIDTRSDVRANPKISGTAHNVFGIQTGVAILFLVKTVKKKGQKKRPCVIEYISMEDTWRKEEKLQWLGENPLRDIPFEHLIPDAKNNWIGIEDNDWESLIPVADKGFKQGKMGAQKALFEHFSLGASTNRDEWIYAESEEAAEMKARYLIERLAAIKKYKEGDNSIKWSRNLKRRIEAGRSEKFSSSRIKPANYRPFVKQYVYDSELLIDEISSVRDFFKDENIAIASMGISTDKPFTVLGTNLFTDLNFLSPAANGCRIYALFRYDGVGNRTDNITDWGLAQFVKQYGKKAVKDKEAIFHYVYAVLHHPAYREKYAGNLKRDFPRIPFYEDFGQWAAWGKALLDLHLHYESASPWPLERITPPHASGTPKPLLKANKVAGEIILDTQTILSGIPPAAWDYKLGNRSALEWILDQYKESRPKDPTLAAQFDTYRFADHRDAVTDLLMKVCTVSVETMAIVAQMPA